jgi:hypothetical protein
MINKPGRVLIPMQHKISEMKIKDFKTYLLSGSHAKA